MALATHEAWSGPCSAFDAWRRALATAAGYGLIEVSAARGRTNVVAEIGDLYTPAHARGHWEEPPEDILFVLLTHSGSHGRIHPSHADLLANRLEELALALDHLRPPLAPGQSRPVPYGYERAPLGEANRMKRTTMRFVRGLRAAAEANEPVEFT